MKKQLSAKQAVDMIPDGAVIIWDVARHIVSWMR